MPLHNENEVSWFWLADGILHFVCKPTPYLDLNRSRKLLGSRLLFQDGVAYPIFWDIRAIKDSSKMARDFMAKEGSILAKAVALYDQGNVGQVSCSHYLLRHRPLVPSICFSEREAALEFLKEYV